MSCDLVQRVTGWVSHNCDTQTSACAFGGRRENASRRRAFAIRICARHTVVIVSTGSVVVSVRIDFGSKTREQGLGTTLDTAIETITSNWRAAVVGYGPREVNCVAIFRRHQERWRGSGIHWWIESSE